MMVSISKSRAGWPAQDMGISSSVIPHSIFASHARESTSPPFRPLINRVGIVMIVGLANSPAPDVDDATDVLRNHNKNIGYVFFGCTAGKFATSSGLSHLSK